ISRIVKNSRALIFIKSFTSSASFWESSKRGLGEGSKLRTPIIAILGTEGVDVISHYGTDIQEKSKKKAKNKQIQARSGKGKVKSQAK
ncbi:hypothetical protein Tco_1473901, partial [Tanacetum coccineum]